MVCLECGLETPRCRCPDLGDRMRELCGPGGGFALPWCARCDEYHARCFCVEPDLRIRVEGELRPMLVTQLPETKER